MKHKTEVSKELNNLLVVCNDGKDFYEYAAKQTENTSLQKVFREMARIRAGVISDLAKHISLEGGEPALNTHSIAGTLRQTYGRFKKALSFDNDAALISELEEAEDRTLEVFRDAIKELPAGDVRSAVMQHFDIFVKTHNQMRGMKRAA